MIARSMTFLLFSFLLASCSTNTKTITQKGELRIRGGKFQEMTWKDSLIFERISWYQELTTLFDGLVSKIDRESPFYNWFSDGEKRLIDSCQDLRIAMTFYHDSKKISERMFKQEWDKFGYESIAVPEFKRNVSIHSDVDTLNLQRYNTFVLCRKGLSIDGGTGTIPINFPGYNTQFFHIR